MALEKKITYDYEVRGEFKCIQEISFSYHRTSFMPDADVSGESDEVKSMASSLWTDAVKKVYEDSKPKSE